MNGWQLANCVSTFTIAHIKAQQAKGENTMREVGRQKPPASLAVEKAMETQCR
jgi:hypothetical protein